jgi:ankyrin repeat protein
MHEQLCLFRLWNHKGGNRSRKKRPLGPQYYVCSSPAVAKLLIEKGASVDARDFYSQTPLHYAVQCSSCDVVELLLKKGADVNAKDHGLSTPLHEAVRSAQIEMAKLLISKGADLNAKDCGGRSPLSYAEGEIFKLRSQGSETIKLPLLKDLR